MADNPFLSPGVYDREIELQKAPTGPFGTPAGVIGTAIKGPAFVPILLGTWQDFITTFGEPDYDQGTIGPYAIKQFLKNANSAVYTRVLGAGYAERDTIGDVPGAGMSASWEGGRATYFLGAIHQSSSNSTYYLDQAAMPNVVGSTAGASVYLMGHPLIKGVLFCSRGVSLRIKDEQNGVFAATGTYRTYGGADESFVMQINNFSSTDTTVYPTTITASFNVEKINYLGKILNTDPTLIDKHGYVLYADFGMADLASSDALMVITGSKFVTSGSTNPNIVFALSGTRPSTTIPNYANYQDRYAAPLSPYVVSQNIGGKKYQLFRVEALSDGIWANTKLKISIRDIRKSTVDSTDYGTFTLLVRDFSDSDENPTILEQFKGLTLDPNSTNFVTRRIGDRNIYLDHDQDTDEEKKIIIDGDFPNISNLIRIVPTDDLTDGNIPGEALPFGFEKLFVLNTSGSMLNVSTLPVASASWAGGTANIRSILGNALVPPIPMRTEISRNAGTKKIADKKLYWGVKFNRTLAGSTNSNAGLGQPNYSAKEELAIEAFTKFFGNAAVAGVSSPTLESPVWLQTDSPTYWKNEFNLENVMVTTASNGDADRTTIASWRYFRTGLVPASSRSFSPVLDLNNNSDVAKYSFFLQYGWDGLDITDPDAAKMNQCSVFAAANGGGWDTNIAASYKDAIDIITAPENTDISILALPDIREPMLTDYAAEKCEDRFDCIYLMDVENVDEDSTKINSLTSSLNVSVAETVSTFDNRNIDTNFAAAYWPDAQIFDSTSNKLITVPASTVVLGAFAFNDKVAFPWFAPAGFNRGALDDVVNLSVRATKDDRDTLYDARINPLFIQAGKGIVVYGQKTLQSAQSALDRVNVRRLMIELRRSVKQVAQKMMFEPNTAATWNKFRALVTPILDRVQEQAGIEKYKLIIDETTTSPADIEGYIMRGKIAVQPTKVAEFIALDFVITNSGAIFE